MITAIDVAWAAGFLEGEGCFSAKPGGGITLSAPQLQREPLERLERMFGGFLRIKKTPSGNPLNFWAVHGRAAAAATMTILVFLSPRRTEQALRMLNVWKAAHGHRNLAKTHCPRGHEYNLQNTRLRKSGWRSCIACDRLSHQEGAAKRLIARRAAKRSMSVYDGSS